MKAEKEPVHAYASTNIYHNMIIFFFLDNGAFWEVSIMKITLGKQKITNTNAKKNTK